ncbi:DUF5677 domain-containing protein [Lentzea sp. NPDC034063]|uniref:DUF5677 domain-containing protein n=1 Tax=unclassified Lentzea TaxID=2643253 RepID=UPI0033C195C5
MNSEDAVRATNVLLEAFDGLAQMGGIAVTAEHESAFQAVFGWWAWINRSGKLVLIAHDAELGHESAPNVRSILEHTLVMQWVADAGYDALETLTALDDDRRRKLFDDAVLASWPLPEGLTRPEAEATKHRLRRKIENFAELCRDYEGAGQIYVAYRLLSTYVHPTAKGAEAFVRADWDLTAYPVNESDTYLFQTAICLIQAARTINTFLRNQDLTRAIEAAQEHLGGTVPRPTWKQSANPKDEASAE